MSNLFYAARYKNKIIDLLAGNSNLIQLLNPAANDTSPVYDYDFTDDTMSEQKTFIIVDTSIDTVRKNLFTEYTLSIYIFTAKECVRLSDETSPTVEEVKEMGYWTGQCANRIDVLCGIVDELLNGSEELQGMGTIVPAPEEYVTVYRPNKNYYGKCLKYLISNINISGDAIGD